jgi:hypothetical protein
VIQCPLQASRHFTLADFSGSIIHGYESNRKMICEDRNFVLKLNFLIERICWRMIFCPLCNKAREQPFILHAPSMPSSFEQLFKENVLVLGVEATTFIKNHNYYRCIYMKKKKKCHTFKVSLKFILQIMCHIHAKKWIGSGIYCDFS